MLLETLTRPLEHAPGLYQLRALGAKVTALVDHQGVVLVDTGWRGSLPLIARGLEHIGASIDRVRLIVITHHHPDHTGDLPAVVRATRAPLAAHRAEAPFITGALPLPNPVRWPALSWPVRPLLPLLYGPPVPVDYPLDDGAALPFRPDVRAVHTPGHTPGSLSLYIQSTGSLIVGDALQYRFGWLRPPAAVISWDRRRALLSIRKLASLDFDTIWFSHFPPLKRNARSTLRSLIARTTPHPAL
ncbi:MAG: MBL fold metallo-hydrolase [Gemmatimonadetes bacterium]|nr:MBL fold metallo-hydrolase [Gemmatimonadota bacterium]